MRRIVGSETLGYALSVLVCVSPGNEFIREPHACLGVDIHPLAGTPCGECVRIDVGFLKGISGASQPFGEALCGLEPLIVRWAESFAIGADGSNPVIVFSPIPSDARN